MALLIVRTFGLIIISAAALMMYVSHKKKKKKFIKRKPATEAEKLSYQKWEKIIDTTVIVGFLVLVMFVTLPCCMDVPYLISGNLIEVSGVVTQGAMAGEHSTSNRRIHVKDTATGEDHSLIYWGTGSDLGDLVTARYLPHTEYGYIIK